MSLKNASFLAFVGTALVTLLLVWDLISNILNVARGLIAATMLLSNLIYAFGAFTVALFFFVFQKDRR